MFGTREMRYLKSDFAQTLYKDSSGKSTWQNRQGSLSEETVSCLNTLTVSSEMCSFDDFVLVLLFFYVDLSHCFDWI